MQSSAVWETGHQSDSIINVQVAWPSREAFKNTRAPRFRKGSAFFGKGELPRATVACFWQSQDLPRVCSWRHSLSRLQRVARPAWHTQKVPAEVARKHLLICYRLLHPIVGDRSKMASSQQAKGCFKCGGTGHWARDCPADPKSDGKQQEGGNAKEGQREWKEWKAPTGKKKQAFDILGPKRIFTRPKLTEDVLLSKEKGIGYILKEFPRLMEIKGRGHEVSQEVTLGSLIETSQFDVRQAFQSVCFG